MNNKTLLLIFAGLLLLFFGSKMFGGKKERSFDPNIVSIDTAKVDRILFHPKAEDFKEIRLQKGAEGWTISKEGLTVPTQLNAGKSILAELQGIKASRIAAKSEDKWADYEVDEKTGNRVQIYEGDKLAADLVVGRFSFNQQARSGTSFLRLQDKPDVYAVDGFLSVALGRAFNDYRNALMLQLNKADITALEFGGVNNFSLSKAPDNRWQSASSPVDSTKMEDYLNAFKNLHGGDFADGVTASSLGNPIHTLSISTTNSPTPINIECYAAAGQDKPFLLRSNLNEAYFKSDSAGLYQRLFKSLNDFQ